MWKNCIPNISNCDVFELFFYIFYWVKLKSIKIIPEFEFLLHIFLLINSSNFVVLVQLNELCAGHFCLADFVFYHNQNTFFWMSKWAFWRWIFVCCWYGIYKDSVKMKTKFSSWKKELKFDFTVKILIWFLNYWITKNTTSKLVMKLHTLTH